MNQDDLCSYDPDVDYDNDNDLDTISPAWNEALCSECGYPCSDVLIEAGEIYCEGCAKKLGLDWDILIEDDGPEYVGD